MLPDFGKYALFIWLCYGISLGVLASFAIYTIRQNRRWKK